MGNNKKALTLIIERLGDVHRAIEFAKEQSDDDLWEDLLMYSETRPGKLDRSHSSLSSSHLLLSFFFSLLSLHPRPPRKHRRRNLPHPSHTADQKRIRDPRVERGPDQDIAGFSFTNLVIGRVSDDFERG